MLCDIHTHVPRPSILSVVDISHSRMKPDEVRMFSIGIHPNKISEDWQCQLAEIERLIHEPNCVGAGECGLDKFAGTPRDLQEKVFTAQLALAQRHGKPVIIHCVRLYTDVLHILKSVKFTHPAIFHGYNGNPTVTAQLLKLPNTYYSFSPSFYISAAKSIPLIPLSRILTETDCDTAADISAAIAKIAEIKRVGVGELEKAVYENYKIICSKSASIIKSEPTPPA